jgi:hypothetical protein
VQFLVLVPDAVDLVMSDESDDLAWFSADLQPDVDASVRALVADAQGWRDSDERRSWLIFG